MNSSIRGVSKARPRFFTETASCEAAFSSAINALAAFLPKLITAAVVRASPAAPASFLTDDCNPFTPLSACFNPLLSKIAAMRIARLVLADISDLCNLY